ncbi:DUF1501 domain-containing protein [Phragmitibacter flavus]|uniref:DUF1501 domain-containing protein n=1 Tax=Phragmitibacter flavus TaxID=2576071 RepID=A0A5R8KCE0_9BACT|nr:DUF1501 domain-containing protein [Phragmitibacter flavus]TLD69984.1 DUF1501 domain-containing protein [Phragmitibacter flavus]
MKNTYLKLDPASRREFMLRTAKAALGVSVLSGLDNEAFGASVAPPAGVGGKAKAVIYLYMAGGMSHIDTFDPKTGETKGYKDPISTNAAGIQLGGYMPKMAKQADKITIVRSTTSKTGVHEDGTYVMHTGYDPRGTVMHPTMGSWAQHFKGRSHKTLPSSVVIGAGTANAGFFPPALAPVPITNAESGLQNSKSSLGQAAFNKRIALMNEFDTAFRDKFKSPEVRAYTEFYDETMNLLTSSDLDAFDLTKEDSATRQLYGNGFGQGCLLARRLVQAGVRFIEVRSGGWDMHNYIDEGMERTGTGMDNAFAALLSDLDRLGMLDSTMVVLGSEFGRTPNINENSGRDHYPKVFSTVFAGGGVKRGFVYGSSDKDGKEVADKQVTVQDFIATIGAAMGLPVAEVVMSPSGRPFTVGDRGKVAAEIFA